jgi:cyclopropane fatty-acyl-phospholipid synthase-like methyltransferase
MIMKKIFDFFFIDKSRYSPLENLADNSRQIDDWFYSHAEEAPNQILADLRQANLELVSTVDQTLNILDFGCGDGIMLASLATKLDATGHGYDFFEIDQKLLQKRFFDNNQILSKERISFYEKDNFNFKNKYDFILSWSVIEHVDNLFEYLNQVRELMSNSAVFYLQTWPLWNSSKGHHLFNINVEPFLHITLPKADDFFKHIDSNRKEIFTNEKSLTSHNNNYEEWRIAALESYESCNRLKIEDIQFAIDKAKFKIIFFKPYFEDENFSSIPMGEKWSDFAISGGRWILTKD